MAAAKGYASGFNDVSVTEGLTSLRGKKPASLYVFAPGDDYFIPQAKEAARSLVAQVFRAFDYAEFEGSDDNVDGIREFLGSESFGSGRKVLVINGLEDKGAKRLGTMVPLFLSGGTTTVIFADPAKVPAELLKKAYVVTSYAVPPTAVRSWIKKRIRRSTSLWSGQQAASSLCEARLTNSLHIPTQPSLSLMSARSCLGATLLLLRISSRLSLSGNTTVQ
jgi:DNA polymerase III delta subunit